MIKRFMNIFIVSYSTFEKNGEKIERNLAPLQLLKKLSKIARKIKEVWLHFNF